MKRMIEFIKGIRRELTRVTWISWEKLVKLTLIVLIIAIIVGLILQLIDISLQYIINNYL